MIASLILAYILVPYVSRLWLHRKAALHQARDQASLEEADAVPRDPLRRFYLAVLTPLQRSRRGRNLFFLAVAGLLIASLAMPAWQFVRPRGINGPESLLGVSLELLPQGNVDTFTVQIQTPAGTALPATDRVAQEVGAAIVENPYVTEITAYLGRTGPLSFAGMVRGDDMLRGGNIAQLIVNLVPKGQRPHTAVIGEQIWKALAPVRKDFSATHIMLFLVPPGPPTRAQVVARLYGPDYESLRQAAKEVKSDFDKAYGMINVHDSVDAPHPNTASALTRARPCSAALSPGRWPS
jgi:multidrug efflux pump subunit AcrB